MRYQITIEIPDELLHVLTAAVSLATQAHAPAGDRPAVRPHRPDFDEPPNVQQSDQVDAIDGKTLFRDLQRRGQDWVKRARAAGKRYGYDWKITDWTPQQAARVHRILFAPEGQAAR